jgi:glutathione synthase/RimK-type ligase-like ATP-grasp enzyme
MAVYVGERMTRRLVIVGNASCRRVAFWQQAADRRGWLRPEIVLPVDLIGGRTKLVDHLRPDAVLRIESMAENWLTMKSLLKHGIEPALAENYPTLSEPEIDRIEPERGRIVASRQCYLGFVRLLQSFRLDLNASGASALNHPDEIAVLFDKPECQQQLQDADVPIPASIGAARDYAEIRSRYGKSSRVVVKLAHGSGAAGCTAIHWSHGRTRAFTTVVEVMSAGRRQLYCSKKLQVLNSELKIAGLVDRLCVDRVQVEAWLPKARWEGKNFDLRIVTIAGAPRHAVARVSHSPFTNLTLGNQRGDLKQIRERMGTSWTEVGRTCERVARVFSRSHSLGIDVLIRPDWRSLAVLEVNAFGELLPNVIEEGEDTYTAMLSAWERRATSELLVAS